LKISSEKFQEVADRLQRRANDPRIPQLAKVKREKLRAIDNLTDITADEWEARRN